MRPRALRDPIAKADAGFQGSRYASMLLLASRVSMFGCIPGPNKPVARSRWALLDLGYLFSRILKI